MNEDEQMKRYIKSATYEYKILTPEDIEYFNKATKQGRNYTACRKLGKKYITDKDMFEWFESELEGRHFKAYQLDDLIADELENEYVYDISDDDDDDDWAYDDDDTLTEEELNALELLEEWEKNKKEGKKK